MQAALVSDPKSHEPHQNRLATAPPQPVSYFSKSVVTLPPAPELFGHDAPHRSHRG